VDRRRLLMISFGGALAASRVVSVPQARADSRPVHVGILGYGAGVHPLKAFRESLIEFGYVEGQNLVIDQRYANGRREKVPGYKTANALGLTIPPSLRARAD